MEIIYSIFFLLIALVLVLSALGVVFLKSIVHSAVSLIVTFLSVAGIFVLLNADFVAISQIIIYAVGITIVLIFAIMLTGKKSDERLWIAFAPRTLIAIATTGCLFLTTAFAITDGFKKTAEDTKFFNIRPPEIQTINRIQTEGTSGIIGEALLTKYALPFEILSLLLLAAILGSVVLARKDNENLVNPTTQDISSAESRGEL